jgi:hypothetical protein
MLTKYFWLIKNKDVVKMQKLERRIQKWKRKIQKLKRNIQIWKRQQKQRKEMGDLNSFPVKYPASLDAVRQLL